VCSFSSFNFFAIHLNAHKVNLLQCIYPFSIDGHLNCFVFMSPVANKCAVYLVQSKWLKELQGDKTHQCSKTERVPNCFPSTCVNLQPHQYSSSLNVPVSPCIFLTLDSIGGGKTTSDCGPVLHSLIISGINCFIRIFSLKWVNIFLFFSVASGKHSMIGHHLQPKAFSIWVLTFLIIYVFHILTICGS
jgi:hypothetical protein